MNLMRLSELKGHDVYEFCRADNYPKGWNEQSLYLIMEDFLLLTPYINPVFPHYHYFGPQKVTFSQWEKVKQLYDTSQNINELLSNFFIAIDSWKKNDNKGYDYFWILGI